MNFYQDPAPVPFVTVGNTGSHQPQLQQSIKSHLLQEQYTTELKNRLRACEVCKEGTYGERSIHDDWDGKLTCDKCNHRIDKNPNKIMNIESNKKKIYRLRLGGDLGELWLDENKNPLSHVHCNDAIFRSEYQKFIIDYFGGELIEKYVDVGGKLEEKLLDASGDPEAICKLLKKYIKNL